MSDRTQIVLTGHMDVPPDRVDAVMAALPEHITLTRAEPGCLSFEVNPSQDRPGRLVVSERFQSRSDFEAHQARITGSHWAEVTRGLVRHYKVTEVPA